jgi:hypothetical protein
MKTIFFILLLLGYSNYVFGQVEYAPKQRKSEPEQLHSLLYVKGHLSLRVVGAFAKRTYQHNFGQYHLQDYTAPCVNVTLDYTYNFDKNWAIRTGFTLGILPDHSQYRFEEPLPQPGYISNQGSKDIADYTFLAIPIECIYRIPINSSLNLNLRAGGTIRQNLIYDGGGYSQGYRENDDGTILVIRERDILFKPNQIHPTLTAGIGASFLLNHYDFLNVHLVGNLGLVDALDRGRYTFYPNDPAYHSEGTYKMKGSYIGLELSYTYTGVRRLHKKIQKTKKDTQ